MIAQVLSVPMILFTLAAGNICGRTPLNIRSWENITPVIDTIRENQLLYNGRIWNNLYSQIDGDQFLFTDEFLEGSVTIKGRTFSDIKLLYDIFRDEILTPYKPVGILQLNKEMIDSFSITHYNSKHLFVRIPGDVDGNTGAYFEVVFNGKIKLYARFEKKIEKLADGGKYDKFYGITRMYLLDNGIFYPLTGRKDILTLYKDDRKVISRFLKENKLKIVRNNPSGFIPVLEFIESMNDHSELK